MLLLGLTGGIAMGKTTVAAMFARRGVMVIDTDSVARLLVEPGQPALAEIVAEFGAEMIDSGGNLRRNALAAIVFADSSARSKLEAILHPRIADFWQAKAEEWRRCGVRIGMIIIPLLFEIGAERHFEATICVACSRASQAARMLVRGWSAEECRQRIGAQWPVERKIELSDYVVWSEGVLEVADAQVERILMQVTA
ncbi:MAG: dephospho-CoA kinase [Verrucomicrobiota bacterium]|nr:dephospho-CoA kinase [Verrucomicrobiota bacterium]